MLRPARKRTKTWPDVARSARHRIISWMSRACASEAGRCPRARFEQVDARFDHVDKELEDVKFQVTDGLGVSSINHLKSREIDHRMIDVDQRLKRLEEKAATE